MQSAVVLMAYGSPERLEDVPAYYADIRGGRPVAPEHLEDLVSRYRRLGIESSNPLNAITEQTRTALEAELGLPVFTGMKHWHPRIGDAAERALAAGAATVAGLVLAPHYSRLSIAGYREQLERALDGRAALAFVESWHDDPGFVALLADRIRGTAAHVVFTAHSLPARILDEGDPYRDQLLETSQLVAAAAGVTDWSFSFQSESPTGEPWLGPDILDHLGALHEQGADDVLVCPVGFVSDHLEIRWDLDTEARERAAELGMRLALIELPNADPRFVRVLAGIVRGARAPGGASRRGDGAGPDRRRQGLAALPGLLAAAADAQGPRRRPRPAGDLRALGPARRLAAGRARGGARARRPQRLGQDDAAAPALRHLQADVGARRRGRARRLAARARRRLPPGLHRPRERLPERVDPRPLAGADP
jgi:ferrochelatase